MSKNFAYTDNEGEFLVKLARKSLTVYLEEKSYIPIPENVPELLQKKSGIFVTLNVYEKGKEKLNLRGCIGRPYPSLPLVKATIDSAIDSGIHDPRFSNVKLNDLDNIVFEITALTPPIKIEETSAQGRLNAVEIGIHGLIIEREGQGGGGLFLPQVPVEWHWNKEEYLTHLCGKAGIPGNMWKKIELTNLYKFRGEIFHELEPNGKIERKIL
jgi:hypothetical protein